MAAEWYYSSGGAQQGPVTLEELKQLAQAGTVSRETLVWKAAMLAWTPAGQVAEVFAAPPPLPGSVKAPPPLPNGTAPSRPKRTLRFEADSPKPSPGGGSPPPAPPASPPNLGPKDGAAPESKQPARPVFPLISIRGALIALAVTCGAGIMGSIGGAMDRLPVFLIFFLVTLVAGLSVLVRGGILLHRGWSQLPMKYRTTSPSLASWGLLIPVFNWYQVFASTIGLSKQTNRALKEKGQAGIAPEGLALAASIAWVAGGLGPLVFSQVWLAYSLLLIQIVTFGIWMAFQVQATNVLNGHPVAAEEFKPWWTGAAAAGGLAVLIAVVSGVAESTASPTPPKVSVPGSIFKGTEEGAGNGGGPGPASDALPCNACNGKGYGMVACSRCKGSRFAPGTKSACRYCDGSGFERRPCMWCGGTGRQN